MQKPQIKILLLMLAVGLLQSCSTLSYYGQAARGQMSLLAARQSVTDLVANTNTDEKLKIQLEKSHEILAFARDQGLPVDNSYSHYVDLNRPYVVWNVFAADPYGLQLKTHCFPIAGCVGYKGYFDRADAEAYAGELKAEGLDVFVGGVTAYSTLGWFNDPLLNTFLYRSDERLAAVLFHELAHKVLYLEGDTVFNESFATAVELYLLKRWLQSQDRAALYQQYETSQQRQNQVIDLILATRVELARAYQDPDADKALEKTKIIASMKYRYQQMKAKWPKNNQTEGAEFAAWMGQDLNNAHLAAIGAYQSQVGGFSGMLEGKSLEEFFVSVEALSELDKVERDKRLAELDT